VMCPAVGQGALAIETRESGRGFEVCQALNHAATRACVDAERTLLASLGGGCQVPIGAHAAIRGGQLHLRAVVIAPDATQLVEGERQGPADAAEETGRGLAAELLAAGAGAILAAAG